MRRSRFTEAQIIGILNKAEAGVRIADLCRQQGISQGTYYRWKAKYGGLEVSEVHRLRQLEGENRRLKQLVADLALDKQALQDALARTGPARGAAGGSAVHATDPRPQ